jgi:HPt (histidine-containing phosphotransfer) domain-containing protein
MELTADRTKNQIGLIDFDRIRRTFGGDQEILAACIADFVSSYPAMLDEIDLAITRSDPEEFAHAAHSFCGVVGSYSTAKPYELCRQLEATGRNHSIDQAPELAAELRDATNRLAAELQKLSEEIAAGDEQTAGT